MLTIYRASAGSGKTFLLTKTYLRLLFSEGTGFENILAVTFTNKATEEMKSRILKELHTLQTEPEQSAYIADLRSEFGLTTSQVKERATSLLRRILHNYADYNVSTIDRFFQQVIRAFTREIGLQGGYDIELEESRVLTEAVDNLMATLGSAESAKLLSWLTKLVDSKVRDGENWNIRTDIIGISHEITKEVYKQNADKLREAMEVPGTMEAYNEALSDICNAFESEQTRIGREAMALMKQHGLEPNDFSYGNGSGPMAFKHWANRSKMGEMPSARMRNLTADGYKGWATKGSANEAAIKQCADAGLRELAREACALFDNHFKGYQTARATLRYTFYVGILADVDRSLRAYTAEHNVMLISDTTKLLNSIIDGSDTPFLYEKIGVQLKHFLLDEFQDTSGMQWDNFFPLVENSLGEGRDDLIVGDVKQSIYRWRNSDWNLLHNGLSRQFDDEVRRDRVLDTNWRSRRQIVAFNNALFTTAARLLQAKFNEELTTQHPEWEHLISDAYADICQQVAPGAKYDGGYVRVEFLKGNEEMTWQEQSLQRLTETIMTLQDKGYKLRDIAILTRRVGEGTDVAKHLLGVKASGLYPQYRFDVISNEALYVGQSLPVATIVNFMRYLHDPGSDLHRATAFYHLATNIPRRLADGSLAEPMTPEEALSTYFEHVRGGRDPFTDAMRREIDELRSMPLFEMTERIIGLVVDKEADYPDLAYVQAFQDLVVSFIATDNADLSAFLRWWDESGVKQKLASPDKQDAIRIMTVHKSKGLDFKAVIIPFASWDIDHGTKPPTILWARTPDAAPFNTLPIVPLRYGKALEDTYYAYDYQAEKLQAFIDNLNVAYVALTRAVDAMYIFAPTAKEPEKMENIGQVMQCAMTWPTEPAASSSYPLTDLASHYAVTEATPETTEEAEEEAGGDSKSKKGKGSKGKKEEVKPALFEVGELTAPSSDKKETVMPVQLSRYVAEPIEGRLALRLHSKGYFDDHDKRAYGTLVHEVLSEIRTAADVEEAIAQCIRKGMLKADEATALGEKLDKLLSNPRAAAWFANDEHVSVQREQSLILSDGSNVRPDRVVITDDGQVTVVDYKTGFRRNADSQYRKQVADYMAAFRAMGYTKVKGYLWYLGSNWIEEVF